MSLVNVLCRSLPAVTSHHPFADVSVAKTEFRRAGLEPAIKHLPPERL